MNIKLLIFIPDTVFKETGLEISIEFIREVIFVVCEMYPSNNCSQLNCTAHGQWESKERDIQGPVFSNRGLFSGVMQTI